MALRVCKTCGRVLNEHSEKGWIHSTIDDPADHDAVPVLRSELPGTLRCDFCSEDDPEMIVPARDFAIDGGANNSRGNWAACTTCGHLIETNQWNALIRRVRDLWPDKKGEPMPPAVEASLIYLYRLLRKNINGAVRRADG